MGGSILRCISPTPSGRHIVTAFQAPMQRWAMLRKAHLRCLVPASSRPVSRGSREPRRSVPLHRLTPQSLLPNVPDFSRQSRSATKLQCSQRNARCERDFISEHHCGDSSTARLKPSGSFGSPNVVARPPPSSFRFPVRSVLPARIHFINSICCSRSN